VLVTFTSRKLGDVNNVLACFSFFAFKKNGDVIVAIPQSFSYPLRMLSVITF